MKKVTRVTIKQEIPSLTLLTSLEDHPIFKWGNNKATVQSRSPSKSRTMETLSSRRNFNSIHVSWR